MVKLSSRISLVVMVLFILLSQRVIGQRSIPCGLNYKIYKTIPERVLQATDTALFNGQYHNSSQKIISETVGYTIKTHFVPYTDGNWKTIIPGINSWFLKLRSNGAYGMALVFTGVSLMPGETLTVFNHNDMRGPYTSSTIPRSGILPLDFLQGDEIVIEYDVPAENKSHGAFVVETVSHAYHNIYNHNVYHSKENLSARINNDCYPCIEDDAIAKERRAVVKLVIQYDSTVKICTGTLVNNTANDNTPYILTAQHCVSNQYDADRTVLIFGFEDDCVPQADRHYITLSGAYHRASLFENDFSILEAYIKPPLEYHPYYAGWDISDQYLDAVTCIHHPQGGPKKISLSNGAVITSNFNDGSPRTPDAFWNVIQWDAGVTEGGSSGAALFNKNNNVIGTLSGGSSSCGAPYNDYFEKLSASWDALSDPARQLKHWLDPIESGVEILNGNDPFEGISATCNTISNVKPGEQQELLPYINGQGYFSGYNSDSIASYAEEFSTVDSAMLTGVTLNVGSVNTDSSGGLLVSIHSSNNGLPGTTLTNAYVPYSRITADSLNYVQFYPYVKLIGDFFISYTLSYSPEDLFALKQVDWRGNSNNTAFIKLSSGWVSMNSVSPDGAGSSLGIKITLCENSQGETHPEETSVNFYPNPVTTVLIARLPDTNKAQEIFHLQVYNLQGQQQAVIYNLYENNVVITTTDLNPGMYVVKLSTLHAEYHSKFVKH